MQIGEIMRFANFVPYPMKITEVAITSYTHKVPCGSLSSPFYAQTMYFHSLFELILLLERIQDDLGYPEQAMDLRTFQTFATQPEHRPGQLASGARVLGTFRISIFFRQNATWQGTLHWVEKDEIANFRSVLELAKLLDSALGQMQEDGTTPSPTSAPELP